MKKIYKYEVPALGDEPIFVPAGSRFLSLVCQDDIPVVYFLTDPAIKKMDKHYFKIIGTGWGIDDAAFDNYGTYIGSVQQFNGQLVWHVWMK